MKLYSQKLELIAINTICNSSDEEVQTYVLSSLDASYFHDEACAAAFKRVQTVAQKKAILLSYTELTEDPALSEDCRDVLREAPNQRCKTMDKATRLVNQLSEYRKTRILYNMAKNISDCLQKDTVDIGEMLDGCTEALSKARLSNDLVQLVHSFGDGGDLSLVERALATNHETLLKTGFHEVDNRNGGLPSEGVAILAATTSGGKSTFLMNLLLNMFKLNKISVANVSLEMNEEKLTRRNSSLLTGIPYWKYHKQALTPEDVRQTKIAWGKLHKFGEKHGVKYSMICPKHSVNITQLLTLVKPYKFKVLGIDYISLLDGVDEENQWRVLSSIARQCKIFSEETRCLVILLAQLDSNDDRVRYSKGIVEHADVVWTWNYAKPEQRELKVIPIRQLKMRDAELYPFDLKESFETMLIDNPDGAGEQHDEPDLSKEPEVDYGETGQQ